MRRKIVNFDFFVTTPQENLEVIVMPIGSSFAGIESTPSEQFDTKPIPLKNLTATQIRALKNGDAFLDFWIEAIDHTKPTANRRLYGREEFKLGMEAKLFKVLRNGDVQPGEYQHPSILPDPKLSPEDNFKIISDRLLNIDDTKITHYIVDTKTDETKTYFRIRTDINNRAIINHMIIGKTPTFSIRTLGEFTPDAEGIMVGTNLIVITTDYVFNPANSSSRLVDHMSELKYIDPTVGTPVNIVANDNHVGTEAADLDIFKFKGAEKLIVAVENNQLHMNIEIPEKEVFSAKKALDDLFNDSF